MASPRKEWVEFLQVETTELIESHTHTNRLLKTGGLVSMSIQVWIPRPLMPLEGDEKKKRAGHCERALF